MELRRDPPPRLAVTAIALRVLLVLLGSAPLACTPAARAHAPEGGGAPAGDHPTSDRRFDDVEYWRGIFDDPARDAWQKPDALVGALRLAPGSTVADLGAGTGYFSRRLAAQVGDAGKVLAVEVEPKLVEHLRARAAEEGTANVVAVLGSADDPRLPRDGVDLVLAVDTYHHIGARVAYFGRVRDALRAGGRVAIVDWKKEPLPIGPPVEHKLDRDQVVDEMRRAGYALVDSPDVLPFQYFLVFRPAPAAP